MHRGGIVAGYRLNCCGVDPGRSARLGLKGRRVICRRPRRSQSGLIGLPWSIAPSQRLVHNRGLLTKFPRNQ